MQRMQVQRQASKRENGKDKNKRQSKEHSEKRVNHCSVPVIVLVVAIIDGIDTTDGVLRQTGGSNRSLQKGTGGMNVQSATRNVRSVHQNQPKDLKSSKSLNPF